MDIIIVCHTEFGFVKDKKNIFDKNHKEGVESGVLNLAKIAKIHKAKISFAVMPEVAEYFPKNINHQIGLHIHPGWQEFKEKNSSFFIGDSYLKNNCKQSLNSTALRDYSFAEQFEIIQKGKDYLRQRLNCEPKFFVAGRWSVNNDTIKALVQNGFTHECSAVPYSKALHHNWFELPRICLPYNPSKDNYQKTGDLPILMVPVSQFFPVGSVNPESVPYYGVSWLKACFLEYYKQNVPIFHICLHSPAMTDSYFINALDSLLSFISKHKNINFKFVSEIQKYPEKKYRTNILPYILNINLNIIRTKLKSIF